MSFDSVLLTWRMHCGLVHGETLMSVWVLTHGRIQSTESIRRSCCNWSRKRIQPLLHQHTDTGILQMPPQKMMRKLLHGRAPNQHNLTRQTPLKPDIPMLASGLD